MHCTLFRTRQIFKARKYALEMDPFTRTSVVFGLVVSPSAGNAAFAGKVNRWSNVHTILGIRLICASPRLVGKSSDHTVLCNADYWVD